MLAFAVRRVEEQCGRRPDPSDGPLIADVCPQSSGLGLAGAGRQHRHRRVVDVQGVRCHHIRGQRIDQWIEGCRSRADPARGLQSDALPGKDLGLPVARQMIVVLRYDDMGEEPRPGAPAGNCVIGCWRRDDRVASAARELLADMPDHLEAAGHVIERLGDLLPDPAQRAAAARAGAPAASAAPASVPRPRSRSLQRRSARRLRAARLDRPPTPRSPARVARPHAPASPRSGRTRPGDNERAGSAAWRSRLEPRSHPAPSRR